MVLSQLQHVFAFIKAVEDINKNTSILPGVHLNFVIRNGYTPIEALRSARSVMSVPNLAGVVSSSSYKSLVAMNAVFANYPTLTFVTQESNSNLADGSTFPYNIQMNALKSFDGEILQFLLCSVHAQRVIVFASNDMFGTSASYLLGDGNYCGVKVEASFSVDSTTTDFTTVVSQALYLEVNIVIVLLNTDQAAMLFRKGFELGLFRPGVSVFGSCDVVTDKLFQYFSASDNIPVILKGLQGFLYWPEHGLVKTSQGRAFLSSFATRSPILGNCTHFVDSYGFAFLNVSRSVCPDLHFSNFHFDSYSTNVNQFLGFTYDAVFTLAYGLDAYLNGVPSLEVNAEKLRAAVINNVSFHGASGYVNINPGVDKKNNFMRGTRFAGQYYKLVNFHTDSYVANASKSFVPIRVASVDSSARLCTTSDFVDCDQPERNTFDGHVPDGYPPYSFSSPPAVLKIGALFSPFDASGNVSIKQVHSLAAFMMAVNHINNKTDGVLDDVLPNSKLVVEFQSANTYLEGTEVAVGFTSAFYGSGVLASIVGTPSEVSLAMNALLTQSSDVSTDCVLCLSMRLMVICS